MTPEDRTAPLNGISEMYRANPHTITPRAAFLMIFKQDIGRQTWEPLGPPYLNPSVRAALESMGYDADEYAEKMEAHFRADGIWPDDPPPDTRRERP